MIQQWTIDDFQSLNPIGITSTGKRQDKGFLETLLDFAATSEEQLAEFSAELESREGPFVVAFGQLPFDLGLGNIRFDAPGDRVNYSVELLVRPIPLSIDAFGKPIITNLSDESRTNVTVTQVVGIICLEDKRARVHPIYRSRLDNLKLLDEPLGSHMVEHWMRLPEVTLYEPKLGKKPLTGFDFQRDVASHVRDHLIFATGALLNAYGIAALIDMRGKGFLYGYHTMIAPGRLAGAGTPVPVVNGLISAAKMPGIRCGAIVDVRNTIQNSIRADNPFLLRLQALHALYLNGEPELALIGVCTALEWFLNQSHPDLSYTRKDGQVRTGSLTSYLGSKHSKSLAGEVTKKLREVIDWRNDATHGSPPSRHAKDSERIDPEFVMEAFCLSVSIYRHVNIENAKNTT